MAKFDVEDQLVKCKRCGKAVVLKGMAAGFFRDVVEPGYSPLVHPSCVGDLVRAAFDPQTVPSGVEPGLDQSGRTKL